MVHTSALKGALYGMVQDFHSYYEELTTVLFKKKNL